MSVINQMLKDLEDRQQPEDLEPNALGQPAYVQAAPKKNNWLLISLLFLIFIALIVISWQMFSARQAASEITQGQKPALNNSPQTNVVEENKEPVDAVELKAGPNIKAVTAEVENTAPMVSADENRVIAAEKDAKSVNSPATETQVKIEEAVGRSDTLTVKTVNAQADNAETDSGSGVYEEPETAETASLAPPQTFELTNTQPSIAPTQATQGSFVIEKSTVRLTPEQRVEQLLEEAKLSFDKGYITEAVDKLQQLLRVSDGHEEARNLLAGAWYGRGELNQAVNVLNDGLQRYPRVELWRLTAAKIFFKENNPAGAFSYLDIGLDGASKEFYSMKGSLARQLKQFNKAEMAYNKLTRIEPSAGTWWLGLAISQDSQGKQVEALQSYKRVLETGGVSSDSLIFTQQRIEQLKG